MYALRRWSVRHARGLERLYRALDRVVTALGPPGTRLERPVAAGERALKGLMFDCRMCGQCVLHETGMVCPMNCPKTLRNGPCGGVRADGGCEVVPAIRCVWVEAWEGSQRMRDGAASIARLQAPVDHRLAGRSAWLRHAGEASKAAP